MTGYLDLTHQTKRYLASMKGQWPMVAKNCGVKHQFICRFMDGRIVDPRVSKIERILGYARKTGWTYQPEQNDS
jgi:predicted transcriptional regulator